MPIEFPTHSPIVMLPHAQLPRDLLFNLPRLRLTISLWSFRRKPESRLLLTVSWIPACAGMIDQGLLKRSLWIRLILRDMPYSVPSGTDRPISLSCQEQNLTEASRYISNDLSFVMVVDDGPGILVIGLSFSEELPKFLTCNHPSFMP